MNEASAAQAKRVDDPYGVRAASPAQMPKRAWKAILARTYKRTWDDNVALIAAGVTFYGFFALLSLLGLIVLAYGFVAEPRTVVEHFHALTGVLPTDIAFLISEQLMTAVKSSEGTKGLGILLAVLIATYGGTNGAAAILTALNIAYEEKEKRSLARFYLQAVLMTVSALLLALSAVALAAAIAFFQHFLPQAASAALIASKIGGYVLLTLVGTGVAATLYRFGPAREQAKWRWITPGSLLASLSWLLLTVAFGLYLAKLTNYSATYGSLAAVVALLTWMYFASYAFLLGAELNSEVEHQTAEDSTTGHPLPLGTRGAWAADHVAVTEEVEDRPEEAREGEKLTAAGPQVEKEN